MKSYIVSTILLGSAGIASAAEYPSIVMDTWCITYLSTYLAQISALPGLSPSRQLTFFGNSSTDTATVSNTYDQSLIASESVTAFGLTTLDISPTQAQSDPEAPSSGPISGSLTDTIITPSLSATEITSSAFATSTGIVEPRGRSVIFLVQASSNQERGIKKREIGGFVGADDPDVCTFALTFNLGDGQLFVGGLPTFYAGENYKALGVQDEDSFVQGAITRTFGISGRTLVFRNSGLPNGEAGFCQDSSGQVYITFTASPPGCIPVTLDVYNSENTHASAVSNANLDAATECQNGRLVGSETLTSGLAISTEASMAETSTAKRGMAENVSSGVFSSREPTTAEAAAFTEVSSLSSSEPSGTFFESSGSKALTTTSSQIDKTSTSASPSVSGTTVFPQAISSSAPTTFSFGAPTTVSSQIDDTSNPATSSVSVTGALSTASLQAVSSSASTSGFGTSTIVSTQIFNTSPSASWQTQTQTFGFIISTVISSELVESFVTIESSILSNESSTKITSSTKALLSAEASPSSEVSSSSELSLSSETSLSSEVSSSSADQEESNLLTTTSNEATDTSSPTFGSNSETSSQPASSDISDTSSSAEETTSYPSTTSSESSTVITTTTIEASTTTTETSTITTETSTTIAEASTTTTELMTSTKISESSTLLTTTTTEASTTTTEIMATTTTAAPQSECQSASSPYTVQGVDFDLSCDGIITGGTSVGVAPANDVNQCVYFCAVYSASVAVHYERATGDCTGFSSMTGTSANSNFDAAIRS
ncbi:hypothetical protein H9Q70_010441 [Fusarium xylarioides]|nr:hypothetical protein H9Q70_010441 [Fusarium xylarioides]KAG5776750.1 hypothetical protein H9Q73_009574 [Fusarium xylarioides]